MKKKINKSLLFSSLALFSSITTPLLTSCKSTLDYNNGNVIDDNTNINNMVGVLPEEFQDMKNSIDNNYIHLNVVNNLITYKDYQLSSVDENGNYRYINERGSLIDHTLQGQSLINKDEFLKKFNYYEYVNNYNLSIEGDQFSKKIVMPNKELFKKDIYHSIFQLYSSNNKSFDIEIINNNLVYESTNNLVNNKKDDYIEFDFTFKFINIKNEVRTITIFDKKIELLPNAPLLFSIKANRQKIQNVINVFNNKYFFGWHLNYVEAYINDNNFYQGKFNPTNASSSFAYPMEFLNLTDNTNFTLVDENAKSFLNNLDESLIKDNIESEILKYSILIAKILPELSFVFKSLDSNPSLGKFLYDLSNPFYNILSELNFLPKEVLNISKELLKSFYTGKGVVDILYENRDSISNLLKFLLKDVLWNLTDLVDLVLAKIKPNMTYDEVLGLKKTINMFLSDDNDPLKIFILKLIDVMLGEYQNEILVKEGNPYILDLIDWILIENFDSLNNILNKFNIKIDVNAFRAIINIYSELTVREKDINGKTDLSKGNVNFAEPVLEKLFKMQILDNGETKWWFMDNLIIILNGFGINIGTDSTNMIYSILNQIYSNELNKKHFNIENLKIAIKEISNALNYLSNSSNYKVVTEYSKVEGKDIKYDNIKHTLNFNLKLKIIFINSYTFNINNILNFLPSDIFLELSKLLNKDSIELSVLGSANTVGQYVRLNLERLLFALFPKNITILENDSFVMEITPDNGKLLYSQKEINKTWYHGFSTIFKITNYFEQADVNNGIVTSALNSSLLKEYYNETNNVENNIMNKYQGTKNLGAYIKYESGSNKQTAQNKEIGVNLISKIVANKITTSYVFEGCDVSKIANQQNDAYYYNKTFKWLDTDLTHEIINVSNNIQFKSIKFDEYKNMIQHNDLPTTYNYKYVSSANGDLQSDIINSQYVTLSNENKQKIINDLFTLGNGIDLKNTQISINPLINFGFTKTINLGVKLQTKNNDGSIKETDLTSLAEIFLKTKLNIELSVDFFAYQVNVLLPEYVLDLNKSNANSFSNKFTKIIFAPRIAIKIPSI